VPELDAGAEFASATDVDNRLRLVDYLPDEKITGTVYLAERLTKPILVEGPAGTGKTELAKSIAKATNARLIRLQCYEGLDEAKALYEWDYRKQLLRIQAARQQSDDAAGSSTESWNALEEDIFSEEYLLTRPLLEAIRAEDRVVLLVDEVDRLDVETEALLLEVLSDYQVSIPELGTIVARRRPLVFLTSNNSRELSEALKRRCLFLHIGYPSVEREREIILARVPGISDRLATQVAEIVRSLRSMDLKKPPSVSETLDWAQTLVVLATDVVTDKELQANLNVLLKNQNDIALAGERLGGLTA
jgi:MoxR-like ATPase